VHDDTRVSFDEHCAAEEHPQLGPAAYVQQVVPVHDVLVPATSVSHWHP